MFLCNPGYQHLFEAAMQIIRPLHGTELTLEFGRFYAGVSADRGNRYFSLIREFFTAYDEFGQVYFFVAKGMEISPISTLPRQISRPSRCSMAMPTSSSLRC
jgi:hypothetical protein